MSRRARIAIVLGLISVALLVVARLEVIANVPATAALFLGLVILAVVIWWL